MRNVFYLILLLFLSSCATLILKKDYTLKISTNLPDAKAVIADTTFRLPANLKIKRSKEDLKIKLLADTIERDYIAKSSLHPSFLYGNLILFPFFPLMHGIDLTNQKRFYYGDSIFLNAYDTRGIIRPKRSLADYWSKTYPTNKRQINLVLSIPWVNSFYFQPAQEPSKFNTGFLGISAGLEYFYKKDKYVSLTGSAVMDFFIPIPAAVNLWGEVETMKSIYVSLTDNYRFRRFSVGYGVNFSRNIWEFSYHYGLDQPPPARIYERKSDNTIGLTLNGYHQLKKNFYIGLIYRPTIATVYPDFKFKYEHLVSLDFKWTIRIKK